MSENVDYKYRGAKALVALQEKKLRSFLTAWGNAKELNIPLPETDDKDYQSLETLLFHVFRASRGYLNWICEKLNLPDPAIDPIPKVEVIEEKADEYLDYLLGKWKHPLKDLDEKVFYDTAYKARWGVEYCIDAMLEHAVMHPVRHEFQLNNLIASR
jgi:uncharacterized damage-inducible protein DinB